MADARVRANSTSASWSRQIGDFDEFAMLFPHWDGGFHQMSRGRFAGYARLTATSALRYFEAHVNQSILTRGSDGGDWVTFIPIRPANEGTVWQGRSLATGDLIVKGVGVPFNNQTTRTTMIASLALPVARIDDAVRTLSGGRMAQNWSTWCAVRPGAGAMARLNRALTELASGGASLTMQNASIRSLADALIDVDLRPPRPAQRHGHARLVERAVMHLHDRLRGPVTATDLCAALRVSDRLLRLAFKRVHGMGPLAFHRLMRLHAVRDELRKARGGEFGVREVLDRWGIRRAGAFAGAYQRQFGERPSETLGVRGWPGVQSASVR